VPTQLANADKHAERRGWRVMAQFKRVMARFKDDGYSGFREIKQDAFVRLIEAIEGEEIDVVIISDVDRLTRNLPDWSRFEKAAGPVGDRPRELPALPNSPTLARKRSAGPS
jgi:DNA invertase Pin-like site-specific DNA recombinase